MLCPANPMLMAANRKPPKVESYSTKEGTFSTSLVIDKPSGTVEGDLLVAVMYGSTGPPSWSGASGWTEAVDTYGMRVAYKVAGASEGSTYTFTASTSTYAAGVIYRISNAQWDAVGTVAKTASGTAGAVTAASIAAAGGVLLGAFGTVYQSGNAWSTPSGMTAGGAIGTTVANIATFYQGIAAGATGSRASTYGSTTLYDRVGVIFSVKAK